MINQFAVVGIPIAAAFPRHKHDQTTRYDELKCIYTIDYLIIPISCVIAGIDLDEARRKREDNIIQLRKDKRDENLQKKRMVSSIVPATGDLDSNVGGGGMQQKVSDDFKID